MPRTSQRQTTAPRQAPPARPAAAPRQQPQPQADEHGQDVDVLEQLDLLAAEGWDDAEEKQFVEVQPGTYQARIGGSDEDAPVINNAKSSGRLQVSFTFTILEGEARGRRQWKHFG